MTRALSLTLAAFAFEMAAITIVGLALVHAAPPPIALTVASVPGGASPAQAPTFDPTIEAAIATATAARLATSGTPAAATMTALARGTAVLTNTATATPTATITFTPGVTVTATMTPTLPPEWAIDALCRCHVPPLPPGPECERLKALYVRDVLAAWATQTTLARGTDTATPTATGTPTATPSPTATATATPAPSATRTATDEPTPTAGVTERPGGVVLVPFAYLRRPRR